MGSQNIPDGRTETGKLERSLPHRSCVCRSAQGRPFFQLPSLSLAKEGRATRPESSLLHVCLFVDVQWGCRQAHSWPEGTETKFPKCNPPWATLWVGLWIH